MSDDKPEFEGEGPERMMRELMAQLKQSQGLPTPYYVVKREELVAHLADRADFWRSEVEEIKSGRRDVVEEVMGHGQVIPRMPRSLQGLKYDDPPSDTSEFEKQFMAQMKEQLVARAVKDARNKAQTFAFLSKHVPKNIPEFGVDLHSARVIELVPCDLHAMGILAAG